MEDCMLLEKETETEKEKEKDGNEVEENPQEMGGNDITPKVGMMFNSLEEVRVFYKNYAQHIGFGTKTRSSWRENGEVTKCVLACFREGKCVASKTCRYATKMAGRTGCKAQINTRLFEDGLWHLTRVNLEHNHLVCPSKARFLLGNKRMNKRVKKQRELSDKVRRPISKSIVTSATRLGAIEKLSVGEKDASNFVGSARNNVENAKRLRFREEDVEAIRQFCMRMQKLNSKFFYLMDIDNEGCLRHAFWADARSRASYQYFGDVIAFDTSYLTNKYDIPFVLFVGVNHHGQSMLLGCGLLSSESIESYVWLFTTWLTCMSGRPPNAIIIDQCKSIEEAVSQVFPRSRYRLCLWHIMKKVFEKIGGFKEREAIIWKLKQVVYDSLRVEEFEQSWRKMIEDFTLQDNEWLQSLYEIRQKWVPIFVKDTFWAGMSTIQCSENVDLFFGRYINLKTSLRQFTSQYEVALEKKYEDEYLADFNPFHKEHDLVSNLPMEKQLRTLYTSTIFTKFQEEVKHVVNCRVTLLYENGPLSIYEVRERMKIEGISEPILKKFEVCFNVEKMEVKCICCSFEFRGILCKHAICVLDYKDVTKLPSQYILQRWRKDFNRLHDIYMHFHEIVELGSMSDSKYKFVLNAIKEVKEKLLAWDEENQDNHLIGSVGQEEIETNRIIDPVHVDSNGQPHELRSQSTIEELVNIKKKKTQRNPTKKSSFGQGSNNSQKVVEREVNDINQCDMPLTQRSIQTEQQDNPFTRTQESINIPMSQMEQPESIGSELGVQPCFGYAPYSYQPKAHQGTHTFQQLMFPEWMRKFGSNG